MEDYFDTEEFAETAEYTDMDLPGVDHKSPA